MSHGTTLHRGRFCWVRLGVLGLIPQLSCGPRRDDSNELGGAAADSVAGALLTAYLRANVADLHDVSDGPFRINLPTNIRLVGSDDPQFETRAILTGTVTDSGGQPLYEAEVRFIALRPGQQPVPAARTNREGVFVRTLIPPGEWSLQCSHDGWTPVIVEGIALTAGQRHRERIVLTPGDPGEQ